MKRGVAGGRPWKDVLALPTDASAGNTSLTLTLAPPVVLSSSQAAPLSLPGPPRLTSGHRRGLEP